ncbi:hypothetical protein D3C75_527480 [compost metagenome]
MLESQHKRATFCSHQVPRVNGHDDKQRTHVEHQDTQWYGVDSARDRFLRIFRFASRNTDDFNAAIGKHHHLQRHNHAYPAIAEEAAVGPQIVDPRCLAAVANPPHDDANTGSNHDDDGGNFEEREPEFKLAEHLHAHQVDGAND